MQVMISPASLCQLFSASKLHNFQLPAYAWLPNTNAQLMCGYQTQMLKLCVIAKHSVKRAALVLGCAQVWSLSDRYQAVHVLIN